MPIAFSSLTAPALSGLTPGAAASMSAITPWIAGLGAAQAAPDHNTNSSANAFRMIPSLPATLARIPGEQLPETDGQMPTPRHGCPVLRMWPLFASHAAHFQQDRGFHRRLRDW